MRISDWSSDVCSSDLIGGPARPQQPPHPLPERAPDGTVSLATVPQPALIYRLSGDYNPLNADPEAARRVGFDRPILHGMSRSEERRVGKECVNTCRSRWSPYDEKKKKRSKRIVERSYVH